MASCHIRTRTLKNGDRRFVVRYRRAGRGTAVEHAGSFGTLKEARLRQALVLDWLAGGLDPRAQLELLAHPVEVGPFGDLADAWLAGRHSIAESTRTMYAGYISVMKKRWATTDPEKITPADVSGWIGELVAAGRKPGTVIQYVRIFAMILDSLPANPARHRSVDLPRRRRKEPEPPDAPDVLALLARTSKRYLPVTVFLEQTGARVSEAIGVAARDLDGNRVRLRADESKGERSRWVDCPEWLVDLLPVKGVERTSLGNTMRRACVRAGIGNIHPHLLRHRRATLWHQSGVVATELAYRLGHSKPSMSLDVYSHVRRLHEIDPSALKVLVEEALHV
jgi:integrase